MYSYKIRLLDGLFSSYSNCIPVNYEAFKFAWDTGDCVEKWETDVNFALLDCDPLQNSTEKQRKHFKDILKNTTFGGFVESNGYDEIRIGFYILVETDVNGNEKIVCCIGDTDLDMDELNNAIIESQKEFLEE